MGRWLILKQWSTWHKYPFCIPLIFSDKIRCLLKPGEFMFFFNLCYSRHETSFHKLLLGGAHRIFKTSTKRKKTSIYSILHIWIMLVLSATMQFQLWSFEVHYIYRKNPEWNKTVTMHMVEMDWGQHCVRCRNILFIIYQKGSGIYNLSFSGSFFVLDTLYFCDFKIVIHFLLQ